MKGYEIKYGRSRKGFLFKMFLQLHKIISAINYEQKWLQKVIADNEIDAVISDNRFGLYTHKIPCIFITHQLLVKTGNRITEMIGQKINNYFIQKYTQCWVPDAKEAGLAGLLSHPKKIPDNVGYIGPLSRFEKTEENSYNVSILPQTFTDIFGDVNDSLNYRLATPKQNMFCNVRIRLINATYPVIVQLTNDKWEVMYEQYSTKLEVLDFLNVAPSKYLIRIIYDANGNEKYDSGNYLKNIQPENSSYFEMKDAVRADWSFEETLELLKQ